MRIVIPLALVFMLMPGAAVNAQDAGCWAQWQALGGPYRTVLRTLELLDTAGAPRAHSRMGRDLLRDCAAAGQVVESAGDQARGLWVGALPAAALIQNNSGYPRPQQDGLRWAGRGLSASFMAGAGAEWGPISAVIAPVASYQANDRFSLELAEVRPGYSPYGSYYHAGQIDLPRRFGDDSFFWGSLGQSFVRADAYGAAIGVSTENLQWGPARRNPLLMSAAAPGFPHVFAGTSRPLWIGIGRVQVEAVWGRLTESEYFDSIPDNDKRLFAGIVAGFSPGRTGLTLGVARSYLRTIPPGGMDLMDQIFGPYTGIRDNPRDVNEGDNQLLSVFFRWVLPESGFEAYGEYARDDHWQDRDDLIKELDHSRAYTVGLEKVFLLSDSTRHLRVLAEATNLEMSPTWQSDRGGVNFYTHSQVRQGYTHRGQLLGAPIGTGSDAQYVAVDYLGRNALVGLSLERVRYDNDAYYRHFAHRFDFRGHDAEITVGLRGGGRFEGVHFVGEVAYSTRYNRDFAELRTGLSHDKNISVSLGAAWTPPLGHRFP